MQGATVGRGGGPLEARAWVAIAALALCILAAAYAFIAAADQLPLLDRIAEGGRLPYAEIDDSSKRIDDSWTMQIVTGIFAAIAWLVWQSLAYRTGLGIGVRNPTYPTRDAILWWFIPIASLFMPKRVMDDVWRVSDPNLRPEDPDIRRFPVDPLLTIWWLTYVGSLLLNRYVKFTEDDIENFADAEGSIKTYLVSEIGFMLAGALAMIVIFRITRRLGERERRVRGGGGGYVAVATQHQPAVVGANPGGSVPPPGYS